MQLARQKAAQAWCSEKTRKKVMDTDLAESFAIILYDYIQSIGILLDVINTDKKLSSLIRKSTQSKKLTFGRIKKLIEIS